MSCLIIWMNIIITSVSNQIQKKIQIIAFPLQNRDAWWKLIINWKGILLENWDEPKYLSIKLNHALTYRTHCESTTNKIGMRNCLLLKLVGSQWGARPRVLWTTAYQYVTRQVNMLVLHGKTQHMPRR